MRNWKHCITGLILACAISPPLQAAMDEECIQKEQCIETDRWDIALAVGYGKRSTPIKDLKDIPMYFVPSIAYYGDDWFFDNGNFGYSLNETENFALNITTSYTNDSGYFNRWDPSNIFVLGSSGKAAPLSMLSLNTVDAIEEIDTNNLNNRNFTLLGGLEAFYYSNLGIFKAAVGHDILNVHHGIAAQLKWQYGIAYEQWVFDSALFVDWKSSDLIQYYYGVRESESLYWNQEYKPSSGWDYGAEITTQYVLAQHWDIVLAARYTKLAGDTKDSPLLSKDYATTFFVGMAYKF
ncbi:MipA/OmpV family protein [Shewanella maritima]|uniref:MipA/OmpV family protein n=1 Tax=Shewanella maritima TaxID=2520507 RepID=UPI003735E59D